MRGRPLPFVFSALIATTAAQAQERLVVEAELVGRLNETYDEAAQVSGPPLVGLRLGPSEEGLSGDSLLVVRPNVRGVTFCVRIMTQDGRFAGSAPYQIKTDNPEAEYVRLSPVGKKYKEIVSRYSRDEVGVRAFATRSKTCLPGDAIHLPLLAHEPQAKAGPHTLVVFANGRSQVGSAALYDADGPGGKSARVRKDCERAGSSSLIAYDLTCRLELPAGFGGRAVLQLSFNDGFATTDYRFDVYLPERGRQ